MDEELIPEDYTEDDEDRVRKILEYGEDMEYWQDELDRISLDEYW